jgi:uncharacterized integral membrane protein
MDEVPAEHIKSVPSSRSRVGTVWISIAVFVLILLLLIIFILQNSMPVRIHYFGATGTMSFGVAMLLAAIVGATLTLLVGTARIVQLKYSGQSKS